MTVPKILLESLDGGAVKEYLHLDPDGNMVGVETQYDDSTDVAVFDKNQELRNARGNKIEENFHHVASIPEALWHRWITETKGEILRDPKLLIAKIKDRDFCKVQTSEKI